MVLHCVQLQVKTKKVFLQLTFVAEAPASFEVLQPASTFSSGVPLPRTINCGVIHFSRSSFIPPLLHSDHLAGRISGVLASP